MKVVSGDEALIEYEHKHLESIDLRRLRQNPGIVSLFVLLVAGSRQLAAAEKQQLQQPTYR